MLLDLMCDMTLILSCLDIDKAENPAPRVSNVYFNVSLYSLISVLGVGIALFRPIVIKIGS